MRTHNYGIIRDASRQEAISLSFKVKRDIWECVGVKGRLVKTEF